MVDDILRIEFTTEGTHIALNKEIMNLAIKELGRKRPSSFITFRRRFIL